MESIEQAAAFAIKLTKSRGLSQVGADELLLACLKAVSRFGIVTLGPVVIDLEELGVVWLQEPEKPGLKVAYSVAVVNLFDLAARIAKAEQQKTLSVEHLLAAFAGEESGLMADLKSRHGITSASWRAAASQLSAAPSAPQAAKAADDAVAQARGDYLSPEQAADALGIHVQTLRGYVRSGKLPALRLAGERAIRIRRTDLEAVMEPLATQAFTGQ